MGDLGLEYCVDDVVDVVVGGVRGCVGFWWL